MDAAMVASRVREAMTASRLTQSGLADQLGVNQSTLSLVIRGKRLPSLQLLQKLATTLKVRAGWLIGDEDPGNLKDDDTREVVRIFEGLDDREKAIISILLRSLSTTGIGRTGQIPGK